ncbi:agamous-like MADS-box protein AGL12 [Telopea speciosissima]|uniref:agamous-like MADS-box protein AGL12 n=1 Tax=Telopea speciosissima TaxID=54955 RepID=UPI001CC41736|nr:agamous-like MADS-box protein AGL12 [Telopea speciosissima]
MARGKVQLKRIENPVHRQVTFCKRRAGFLKKAKELSILCDAEIGIMIFSTHGKLYELSTKGSMEQMIERYMKSTRAAQIGESETKFNLELQEEINNLKQEIQQLQKGLGYIYGRRNENMTMDELLALEKHLEIWMCNIRTAKMQIMFQEIQLLKNKEGILTAANGYLQGKIFEQTGIVEMPPALTGLSYPLTIQNEVFQT